MAKATYPGTAPSNRRHGLVYATQRTLGTIRALGIPLQPAGSAQAVTQTNFAAGAQWWAGLSDSDKSFWVPFTPSGSTPYATAMAWTQVWQTWGVPQLDWYGGPYTTATNLNTGIAYLTVEGGRALYTIFPSFTGYTDEYYYAQLYLDPTGVIAQWVPGGAGGSPVNTPQNPKLVYCGYFGPLVTETYCQIDVTDLVNDVMGQFGQDFSFHWPSPDMEGGSFFQASLVITDEFGRVPLVPPATLPVIKYVSYAAAWNSNPAGTIFTPLTPCTLTRKPAGANPPFMPPKPI